jgi:hypothetical protein
LQDQASHSSKAALKNKNVMSIATQTCTNKNVGDKVSSSDAKESDVLVYDTSHSAIAGGRG